ncbi:putative membrane protein, partial [Clostridioides difficile CD196]
MLIIIYFNMQFIYLLYFMIAFLSISCHNNT